jgi:cysteine desulfurase
MNEIIYLDNNATTPVDPRVLEAMLPYFTEKYANANSTHKFGLDANDAVKIARKQVANLIGADTNEIIFTSGATESINLALKGIAESYSEKGKHIITVSTEHSAVLDTCKFLSTIGYEITYLPVDSYGLIDLELLKSLIRTDTILVSVMHVNNETGVIQPIKEIAEIIHAAGSIFMSDCTQSVGKIEVNVDELGIDILCFSGHKMYAPKGIGVLFVRQRNNRIKVTSQIHGGGHERGLRSGTLNVPYIVALGKACELAINEMKQNETKIRELRDYLETELLKIEGAVVNGSRDNRIYNTLNIQFRGIDSDALIMGLSDSTPIVAVSNGSACTSHSIEPSHVLIAIGLNEIESFNSVRFSIGKFNCIKDIDIVIKAIITTIYKINYMNS